MPAWLPVYAAVGRALQPALAWHLRRRRQRGKEDPDRVDEKLGRASKPRPAGPVVWIHAASIGESLSMLPVIDRLVREPPRPTVLVTTVTRSSADILTERLPQRAVHAYAPLDTEPALRRFLDHWRPDATVVVEQELWPLLLARSPAPRLLVNARLSARSARRWGRFRPVAAWLLGRFDRVLAQSGGDGERLRNLGAAAVETPGNLKLAASPLPAPAADLSALRDAVGRRPVWVAASTHAPEEDWIEEVDRTVRARFPDLLTVIVPRHPARAERLAADLGRSDLALRSAITLPTPNTGLLLVDRFGELGLFYRLAGCAFVGGSLVPHGGQNPLEPARLGCPVLIGPHVQNFAEATAMLVTAGGAQQVSRATLARSLSAWLADEPQRVAAGRAAEAAVASAGDAAVLTTVAAIRGSLGSR